VSHPLSTIGGVRILHTSDWHLGRTFGPLSLEADQRAFLDWLVDEVAARSVDLVVIAGDIYDRAIAPNESLVLFRQTLHRLRSAGATVVAITGNHDGADRVSPYDTLVDASGVYIRGGYTRPGEVITLEFADGPLDVVAVPFLEPQLAPDHFDADAEPGPTTDPDPGLRRRGRTHQSVIQRALELARPALSAPRSLAVAHAFVAGGVESDSERQLTVGGAGQVDASLFRGFSYVALGHLHRPQSVGVPHLRYSGSPLAYSFSETQPKSVTIIDLDAAGGCEIDVLEVPVGRGVLTVTGTIDELCSGSFDVESTRRFVRAVLTDRGVVLDAKARLSAVYPYVVEIELRPDGCVDPPDIHAVDVSRLEPLHAASAFWAEVVGSPPTPDEAALLGDALAAATAEVGA
jgi:DNA repair protein SbcD/Mre11